MWYVYIAECRNNTLYTGITTNMQRRLIQHRQGTGGAYTRTFGVTKILYCEEYPTKSDALKREIQIKALKRNKKLMLVHTQHHAE
ncbi:MAG: GIY-YIG nuclease family protein [Elusimicrobia bacterium]|nr:GIY-YIG nuclease family protein [Elusimicrobiota bacterium]MBD3412490.1 GIY-YIG nuclease family protein [Elusimicrobiota bacterium]